MFGLQVAQLLAQVGELGFQVAVLILELCQAGLGGRQLEGGDRGIDDILFRNPTFQPILGRHLDVFPVGRGVLSIEGRSGLHRLHRAELIAGTGTQCDVEHIFYVQGFRHGKRRGEDQEQDGKGSFSHGFIGCLVWV